MATSAPKIQLSGTEREDRRRAFKNAMLYMQARKKHTRFALPPGLERNQCLYRDVMILKSQDYKALPPLQSEVRCETWGRKSPSKVHVFTDSEFWDYVFSSKWDEYPLLRICEGRLLNQLLDVLQSLTSNGKLVTYMQVSFENMAAPEIRHCKNCPKNPPPPGGHKKKKENTFTAEISFTYYGVKSDEKLHIAEPSPPKFELNLALAREDRLSLAESTDISMETETTRKFDAVTTRISRDDDNYSLQQSDKPSGYIISQNDKSSDDKLSLDYDKLSDDASHSYADTSHISASHRGDDRETVDPVPDQVEEKHVVIVEEVSSMEPIVQKEPPGEVMLPSVNFDTDVDADINAAIELLAAKQKRKFVKLAPTVEIPLTRTESTDEEDSKQLEYRYHNTGGMKLRGGLINPDVFIVESVGEDKDKNETTMTSIVAKGIEPTVQEFLNRKLRKKRPDLFVRPASKIMAKVSEMDFFTKLMLKSRRGADLLTFFKDDNRLGTTQLGRQFSSFNSSESGIRTTMLDERDDEFVMRMPGLNPKYSSQRMARLRRDQEMRRDIEKRPTSSSISIMCRRMDSFVGEKYKPFLGEQRESNPTEPTRISLDPIAFVDKPTRLPRPRQKVSALPPTRAQAVAQPELDLHSLMTSLTREFSVRKELITVIGRYSRSVTCITITRLRPLKILPNVYRTMTPTDD